MITAKTRLYAVLGCPVSHSLSPVLHNGWIADHGLDAVYAALDVSPEGVACVSQMGLAGANVTLPHKEAALRAASTATERARRIGAANVLTVGAGRALHADNTDAPGFLAALQAGAPDWSPAAGPAVVLGAGGAARAVTVALSEACVGEIRVVNRTRSRADALIPLAAPATCRSYGWDETSRALEGASLIVNATSQGLGGENPLTLDLGPTRSDAVVFDTVYTPLETPLLSAARSQGRLAVDGLGMLVWQAALAFELWFGVRPDTAAGRARARAVLGGG